MKLEVTAYSGLGPGPHDINVTGLEVKASKRTGASYLRWEFTDAEGKTATENSSIEITPGNKTGRWIASLTGRPIVVGESVDTSIVLGLPGSIFIEEQDGYPKVISVQGRSSTPTHHNVSESIQTPNPVRSASPVAAAPAAGSVLPAAEEEAATGELPF